MGAVYRCIDLSERNVGTHTVCVESSLVLISEVGSTTDKNKAALGTQGTCGHISFKEVGASHLYTALMLKI